MDKGSLHQEARINQLTPPSPDFTNALPFNPLGSSGNVGHLPPVSMRGPAKTFLSVCLVSLCIKHKNLCSVAGVDLPHTASNILLDLVTWPRKRFRQNTKKSTSSFTSPHGPLVSWSNCTTFLTVVFSYFGCVGVFSDVWAFLWLQQAEATLQLWCLGFAFQWLLLFWSAGFRYAGSNCCGTWA